MDLHDIGRILKEEREKKGYSIEDVYKATKISIMNIEAIEKGDFDMLPHPIYTRAFIKTYAEFLSLDANKILDIYDSVYNPPKLSTLEKEDIDISEDSSKWIWILLLAFFIFIGFSVYFFKTKKENMITKHANNGANSKIDSFSKEISIIDKSSKTDKNLKSNLAKNNFLIEKNNTNNTIKLDLKTPSIDIKEQNINSTNTTNGVERLNNTTKIGELLNSTVNSSSVVSPTNKTEEHLVKIVAKDTCWLRGEYDGNHTKEALLTKGDVIVFKFKEALKVKVGNLGGIDVFFDGKNLSFNAKKGQVKTLRFP